MSKVTMYRVCHVCLNLTLSDEHPKKKCDHCGKHFIKFFSFDERFVPAMSDKYGRPPFADGEVIPISGLSVVWENVEK